MADIQYHALNLFKRSSYLVIETTDNETMANYLERVRQQIPGAQATKFGDKGIRFERLKGKDSLVAQDIKRWLINDGWELLVERETYSSSIDCTFRRPINPPTPVGAGTIPDVGDQLEKLAKLRQSNAITEAEYAAAKRKLLGL